MAVCSRQNRLGGFAHAALLWPRACMHEGSVAMGAQGYCSSRRSRMWLCSQVARDQLGWAFAFAGLEGRSSEFRFEGQIATT